MNAFKATFSTILLNGLRADGSNGLGILRLFSIASTKFCMNQEYKYKKRGFIAIEKTVNIQRSEWIIKNFHKKVLLDVKPLY